GLEGQGGEQLVLGEVLPAVLRRVRRQRLPGEPQRLPGHRPRGLGHRVVGRHARLEAPTTPRVSTEQHSVKDFLNQYMRGATREFDFDTQEAVFRETFQQLAAMFPSGIVRATRRNITPINLYEGIAVGAALALQKRRKL